MCFNPYRQLLYPCKDQPKSMRGVWGDICIVVENFSWSFNRRKIKAHSGVFNFSQTNSSNYYSMIIGWISIIFPTNAFTILQRWLVKYLKVQYRSSVPFLTTIFFHITICELEYYQRSSFQKHPVRIVKIQMSECLDFTFSCNTQAT